MKRANVVLGHPRMNFTLKIYSHVLGDNQIDVNETLEKVRQSFNTQVFDRNPYKPIETKQEALKQAFF